MSAKLGGPKWLRDIWIVELHDGTSKVAAVLDRTFRKKWDVDDADATKRLLAYDFQAVVKRHLRAFLPEIHFTEWRTPPKSVNERDLIYFEDFNDMSSTAMWRVINVRNRRTLKYWLDQLDEPSNVGVWVKHADAVYTEKQLAAAPALAGANLATKVYERYRAWCSGNDCGPVSSRKFAAELQRNGIKRKKTNRGRVYYR